MRDRPLALEGAWPPRHLPRLPRPTMRRHWREPQQPRPLHPPFPFLQPPWQPHSLSSSTPPSCPGSGCTHRPHQTFSSYRMRPPRPRNTPPPPHVSCILECFYRGEKPLGCSPVHARRRSTRRKFLSWLDAPSA